jgi:hypothetical protein
MTMTLNLLGTNMTDKAWIRRWTILAAGLATLAGTAIAIAQPASPPEPPTAPAHNDGFDKPLDGEERETAPAARGTSQTTINDGDHSYSVRTEDGRLTRVELDGKRLSQDRYRQKDGKVEILDEDGNVMKTIDIDGMGFSFGGRQGEAGRRGAEQAARNAQRQAERAREQAGRAREQAERNRERAEEMRRGALAQVEVARPKVMIGVTLTDADAEDETQTGVRVDSVMDDLPAAKAGMREGDVIIKLNNENIPDGEAFRAKLRTFNPGDKIDITVKRDDQEKILSLELEKYDPEKMGATTGWGIARGQFRELENLGQNMDQNWQWNGPENFGQEPGQPLLRGFTFMGESEAARESLEEARESIEAALESLGDQAGDVNKAAIDGLKVALESIAKAKESLGGEGNVWTRDNNGRMLVLPRVPVAPRAPRALGGAAGDAQGDATAEQLRLLREQLQRMEDRMKELEKR